MIFYDIIAHLRFILLEELPELAKDVPPCPRLRMFMDMPSLPKNILDMHGWSKTDRSPNIHVIDGDPSKCLRLNAPQSTDCIRGNIGFTEGTHCWEIRWPRMERGTNAVVGVATDKAPIQCFNYKNLVGSDKESWGWDLGSKKLFHGSENVALRSYPEFKDKDATFIVPEKILVLLDMDAGTLSFVIDGKNLGVAFTGLKGKKLYPIVNIVYGYCQVSMNYLGGLKTGPPSLKALCRLYIRESVGSFQVETAMRLLNMPWTLKHYLCNSRDSIISPHIS